MRKSWQVFHDRLLLGRCFRGFVLPVLEYCSAVWCLAADTHLRLLDHVVSGASFLTGVCLSVTLHIVDLWQYYVCCTRSGITHCTLFMVLFLFRMCRCGLHAALWSHIGTLMPPAVMSRIYSAVAYLQCCRVTAVLSCICAVCMYSDVVYVQCCRVCAVLSCVRGRYEGTYPN